MNENDEARWDNFETSLRHLDTVNDVTVTCTAFPMEITGTLSDGRPFEFRAQQQHAALSVVDPGEDIDDERAPGYRQAGATVHGGADAGPTRELTMVFDRLVSQVS